MATITGLTAERMLEIENASVVEGDIDPNGHLILTTFGGTPIDAGSVVGPVGPMGPVGPAAISAVPGEVRLWSGSVLPAMATFGRWVWADGGVYVVASHPIAAGHIAAAWRTAHGASDPGAANFRVPDLRGLTPAGMDAMPGGARANRMTRSVAITIAAKTGEETHVITIPEMPNHDHNQINQNILAHIQYGSDMSSYHLTDGSGADRHFLFINDLISPTGGSGAHENVQPTVFVPYIVYLDG